MQELFHCKQCGNAHEALTQEVAAYLCPNIRKSKGNSKVLDLVSEIILTKLVELEETHKTQERI